MAMLPLGEYNRRIVDNNTFSNVDGIQALYTIKTDIGRFKLHADYGSMVVEKQCDTQIEATKAACRPGYEIEGAGGNYDLGLTYTSGPWTAFIYRGELLAKTKLVNPKDPISAAIVNKASDISYSANKVGLRYDNARWWAQTELMKTDFKLAKRNAPYVSVQTSVNAYGLAGIYWTDAFSSYVVYSHGKSSSGSSSLDRVIGSTYTVGDTTVSAEYHKGSGKAWEQYFAPNNNWNSWVLSVTTRF